MDVLVAGASGFVGSRLCPALQEAGRRVRAMAHALTISISACGRAFEASDVWCQTFRLH